MDEELKNSLLDMVLEYTCKINELENRCHKMQDEKPILDCLGAYKKEYLPLFKKYCTDKKRTYGGQGNSYGYPCKYDGIENAVEKSVEFKNKNRALVYFKTENYFKSEYLFVVLRKNDEWKIDSYKERRYGDEKWDNAIL